MDIQDFDARIVEALLIASDAPITQTRLNECLDEGQQINLEDAVAYLNEEYEKGGHSFFVKKVAGGYQLVTKKDFEGIIRRYINRSGRIRLSYAALETLAIIAYKQPVSRPDIEAIRGVNSEGVISTLLERDLITVQGRSNSPGRPLLYGVTQEFLCYFGLNSISDLPQLKELKEILHAHSVEYTYREDIPEKMLQNPSEKIED
ncbi:MAG: SMC-Scp complex subunit ScpB [Candidatus Marinimicrobia bacterium]|nr:SMC-Scp complex subunit ScpB [Candidatus Neomarinimicrobiota bacterium]MDD5583169.1 SMC-Scp complex subunit ScpB [Candidatus Neomarinimicrobiota bacterium]